MKGLRANIDAARRPPRQFTFQTVACLPVRQAFEGLHHHHRGQHPSRDRRPPKPGPHAQVSEIGIPEQPATLDRQKQGQPDKTIAQHLPRRILEPRPTRNRPQSHTINNT